MMTNENALNIYDIVDMSADEEDDDSEVLVEEEDESIDKTGLDSKHKEDGSNIIKPPDGEGRNDFLKSV